MGKLVRQGLFFTEWTEEDPEGVEQEASDDFRVVLLAVEYGVHTVSNRVPAKILLEEAHEWASNQTSERAKVATEFILDVDVDAGRPAIRIEASDLLPLSQICQTLRVQALAPHPTYPDGLVDDLRFDARLGVAGGEVPHPSLPSDWPDSTLAVLLAPSESMSSLSKRPGRATFRLFESAQVLGSLARASKKTRTHRDLRDLLEAEGSTANHQPSELVVHPTFDDGAVRLTADSLALMASRGISLNIEPIPGREARLRILREESKSSPTVDGVSK